MESFFKNYVFSFLSLLCRLFWLALSIHRPGFGLGRIGIGARRTKIIFNCSGLKLRFLRILKPGYYLQKGFSKFFYLSFSLSRFRPGGRLQMVLCTRSLGRKRKLEGPAPSDPGKKAGKMSMARSGLQLCGVTSLAEETLRIVPPFPVFVRALKKAVCWVPSHRTQGIAT